MSDATRANASLLLQVLTVLLLGVLIAVSLPPKPPAGASTGVCSDTRTFYSVPGVATVQHRSQPCDQAIVDHLIVIEALNRP